MYSIPPYLHAFRLDAPALRGLLQDTRLNWLDVHMTHGGPVLMTLADTWDYGRLNGPDGLIVIHTLP